MKKLLDFLFEEYFNLIGSYDIERWSIELCDVPKSIEVPLIKDILKITTNLKIVTTKTTEDFINIKILDIDL